MKSERAPEGWVIRLDPGEEIPRHVISAAAEAGVTTASVTGIGALDRAVLAFYDVTERRYVETLVDEPVEVVSFMGNLVRLDGAPFLHAHAIVSRRDATTLGGHLMSARVSLTLELVVRPIAVEVTRKLSEAIGLKLLEF